MNGNYKKYKLFIYIGINFFLLAGCLPSSNNELKRWMEEEASRIKRKEFVKLDDEYIRPQSFRPVRIDPFQAVRIGIYVGNGDASVDYTKNPNASPLKDVSLQDLKLVGLIINKDQRMAVVKHGPNMFRVGVGTRIGASGGVVIGIDGDGLKIKQRIDDGTGKIVSKVTIIKLR
ncbi:MULTISPECIES: pilus assembly protein PilP [Candidatus Ichthyocystis]|uniref:Putative type 4 fimbrial protein PilP n=1 Tax=Candidatus Ichthyocystis hellenicum TaxID=1561003 RepID=A0A0S4M2U7_9BURK|nr:MULTISPECIES: pilus assembly protein PilP [Ichthyocystis]CUT17343.1 putative type 4 fimbrial protein PilP [Candidatus Ichthyocystis hellenicum]